MVLALFIRKKRGSIPDEQTSNEGIFESHEHRHSKEARDRHDFYFRLLMNKNTPCKLHREQMQSEKLRESRAYQKIINK